MINNPILMRNNTKNNDLILNVTKLSNEYRTMY